MWLTSSLDTVLTPTAVALGNFDGVHRGHRQVIQSALAAATQAEVYPTVVTFHPHPQAFFTGQSRLLLTPVEEKVQQLEAMGITQMVALPFDRPLAELSPEAFVETILLEQLQAQWISVGQDFRFGKKRAGTVADLQAIAAAHNVEVHIVPLHTCKEGRISSSQIRTSLTAGDLAQANRLLGRPYSLIGTVVQGQQLGRTIGFPTANLQLPPEKFLPRQGVYRVRVTSTGWEKPQLGVMNLGNRPTVDGVQQTTEVHLLDWSGDLYGQMLTVDLEAFLRPEQKFASLEALKAQIHADCETARQQAISDYVLES